MKSKIYLLFILTLFVSVSTFSQKQKSLAVDTGFFNYKYWNGVADKKHMSASDRAEMIKGQKAIYLEELTHQHIKDEELVWVTQEPVNAKGKKYNGAYVNAGPCTNVDFEQGNFNGWTRSTGFNPLTNSAGCCATTNGDQTIISTAGNDPYGGFPMIYPGGGSFSARLGSTATGGKADRISQTFFVTAATANFTYRYAAVLNDGGHSVADQPRFTSEIIDTLGNPITCTFYQVSAGSGVTGYSTSALGAPGNNSPVIYKPWTNVTVDLTPNIGQNVTLRFTVYDCGPSGHFAYAYIDGVCTNYETAVQDTTCPNIPVAMCAPAGFLSTNWNGPGVVNDPNQCIIATIPGVYTCTTLLVPGCPGPTFSHTLTNLPAPVLSFTSGNASACAPTYSFISTRTISSGFIQSYFWDFGDGTQSTAPNPVHVYGTSGTFAVKLRAVSNRGCADSVINFVTIFPNPNLSFVPYTNCLNSLVQFTNTSSIVLGSIVGYTWSLGTGNTSVQTTYTDNPTETYTALGTYTIVLQGQSNQGCISTLTQTLGIFPPPIVSFTANPLCDKNGTAFTPSVSTSVNAGSVATSSWNFGDGQTSTLATPVHTYNAPGTYTVTYLAMSNHGCYAAASNTLLISPSPTVAFTTTSINACTNTFTFTNNSGISSGFVTYTWSFGGTNTTTATNPTYVFPTIGNYTVKLIGVSNLGCGDTVVQKIQLFPIPTLTIAVPASCESAIFTTSASPSSGTITSYSWNFGDPASGALNTSTLQNPTHFYSQTNTYTLILNIVSNLNCPSSQSIVITVFPNPVATFTYSTANNCSLPFAYVNTSTVSNIGSSSIASSFWDFGFPAGVSTVYNPGSINFPGHGTYTVTHITTTNHNCKDTVTHVIQVHPLPSLTFSLNSGCVNLPVQISSSASISPIPSAGSSLGSLFWSYGDGNTTVNPNTTVLSSHTWTIPGTYSVSLSATSNMGCPATVQRTVDIYPTASPNFSTSGTTCLNSGVQFTSNPTVSSGTIFAMNWDFGDGSFGSNAVTNHTYTAPGDYAVTYSLITNNECLTTLTKTVSVYPVPALTSTANGGCLKTVSYFTTNATIPAPGTVASYTTIVPEGSVTTTLVAQNANYTYSTSGTHTALVMATSNNGCLASVINTIVIDPLPQLSFSPHDACQGAPVQFSITQNIATGSINTYTWNFGNGQTSNLMTPAANYSTFGVYTVTFSATSNLGCSNSTLGGLAIHPYPQLTVTPIHNSCVNDSIRINTNISIYADAVQSYSLNFGDGATSTYTNVLSTYSVNHKYTAYNTYTITLSAISTFGCKKDTTAPIIVYPKPFVNWTASKFCYGDSTEFLNSSTIPTGYTIDSHLWNFSDNSASPTSTLSNPKHMFQTSNSFSVYAVSLTELSHPEGTLSPVTCSLIVAKTITVFPRPVASFATNSVCLGNATQFSNSTPTLNIAGWSWYQYNNGVLSGLAQNPAFTYSAAGTYTAALVALNTFGCRDTTRSIVKVYQNPVALYTAPNNCLGLPSVFTNSTTFPEGTPAGSVWSIDNTTLTTTDAAYPFSTAGTYTVALTASSDLGCKNTYTSTVTVYPLPTVNFSNSQTCIGQNTQFNNLTQGNIVTYAWNFGEPGSGVGNTSGLTSPTHQYATSGTYVTTLIAVTDKNCSGSSVNNVIVHNKPIANFTHTTICATEKLGFTDLSTTQDGALTTYDWDFNGDNIVDQSTLTPSYVYNVAGSYQIKLTVTTEFGCTDDTLRQVTVNPKVQAAISSDFRAGCPTLCVNFKDISSLATPGATWTTAWDFSDGSPTSTYSTATRCFPNTGNYDVDLTLVSQAGCRTRQFFGSYINVYPLPRAGFKVEPEQVDEDEPIITISNLASADASTIRYYVSDGSNFGTPNFTHLIKNLKQTKPMVVQIAKNQFGCVDTIMQVLDIKPAYTVYFPNVFTPNGDGINDDFRPKGVGVLKFTIQIYDRWGHQVFKSNNIEDVWTGQLDNDDNTKEDVYTWKAQVTDVFNKNHFMVGHVTVIR